MKCKICREEKPGSHFSEARTVKHRLNTKMVHICNECIETMKSLME